MACSTIFSGFNQPVENKALLIIIKDIKEGKYKADIENIRALILSGDPDKADKLKKQLPAFTPSGTFKGGRKAFHHERISSSKKTNNEYIEVNEPRLAVALSGTPNQVTGLIATAEDGLFSRFIFYAYKVEQLWRDVSPYANNINLTEHFNNLSEQVYELILFLNQSPAEVELSQQQWQNLNNTCSQWLQDVTTFTGDDAGSIVKRLGLVLYRIAMIFTALRKFENGDASEKVICTDLDFNSALKLADIFFAAQFAYVS
ncbi:MAG: DUF3987 domain-containing protein [Bacteroidales bacterium]|nr:DUF3987 domain-containing protein [Bacteroidales bacterium]